MECRHNCSVLRVLWWAVRYSEVYNQPWHPWNGCFEATVRGAPLLLKFIIKTLARRPLLRVSPPLAHLLCSPGSGWLENTSMSSQWRNTISHVDSVHTPEDHLLMGRCWACPLAARQAAEALSAGLRCCPEILTASPEEPCIVRLLGHLPPPGPALWSARSQTER